MTGRDRAPLRSALIQLALACNAYRPVDVGFYGGVVSFALGWPVGDLPRVCMAVSMADTVRHARSGRYHDRRGATALGLMAACWLVLDRVARRNRGTAALCDGAVRRALGADHRSSADPALPQSRRRYVPLSTLLAHHRYVARTDRLDYGPEPSHQLDVWRRTDLPRAGRAPVVIEIPGGGWVLGSRRGQAYPLLAHLVERGWVAVSIDYRAGPHHTWPAQIDDVTRAIDWVRESITRYGGDPDFIVATGGSAGGHLASLAALRQGTTDTSLVANTIKAVVPLYGRYDWCTDDTPSRRQLVRFLERVVVKRSRSDDPDTFAEASPILQVSATAPPFYVLHGTADSIIPIDEARDFVAAMRSTSSNPVAYCELPGAQHCFDILPTSRARAVAASIETFLSRIRATQRDGSRLSSDNDIGEDCRR